jgi:hypothetical protein
MRRAKYQILVCAACVLAAAAGASAQTVTAGVKAGAALSSVPNAGDVLDRISFEESVDVRAKLGIVAGGFVQIAFNERFSLQPEMLFVMKGVKLDLPADAGSITASLNYVELPLLARYTRALNDVLRGYIIAGPSFALKAGTSSTLDAVDQTADMNIDPAFGSRDIGVAFGGGLERDRFLLEARYTLGLTDIATDFIPHDDALRNRVFSVMVGIRLP